MLPLTRSPWWSANVWGNKQLKTHTRTHTTHAQYSFPFQGQMAAYFANIVPQMMTVKSNPQSNFTHKRSRHLKSSKRAHHLIRDPQIEYVSIRVWTNTADNATYYSDNKFNEEKCVIVLVAFYKVSFACTNYTNTPWSSHGHHIIITWSPLTVVAKWKPL